MDDYKEDNNKDVVTRTMCSDLVIELVEVVADCDEGAFVRAEITNNGPDDAGFFAVDINNEEIELDGLQAWGTKEITHTLPITEARITANILAYVDISSQVSECNEYNNRAERPLALDCDNTVPACTRINFLLGADSDKGVREDSIFEVRDVLAWDDDEKKKHRVILVWHAQYGQKDSGWLKAYIGLPQIRVEVWSCPKVGTCLEDGISPLWERMKIVNYVEGNPYWGSVRRGIPCEEHGQSLEVEYP